METGSKTYRWWVRSSHFCAILEKKHPQTKQHFWSRLCVKMKVLVFLHRFAFPPFSLHPPDAMNALHPPDPMNVLHQTALTINHKSRNVNKSNMSDYINKDNNRNICKAFIHASEDCIHGNAMKGTKFEQLMGDAYKMLCETQLREEQTAYELLVRTNRNSLGDPYVNSIPGHNPPSSFFPRHGKDLLRHFKINISPAVSRYCGIRATTPIGKGQNEMVYTVAIDALYRERVGKPFLYGLCYDYLRNQEKWKKF
jgi:hypothetical protein